MLLVSAGSKLGVLGLKVLLIVGLKVGGLIVGLKVGLKV